MNSKRIELDPDQVCPEAGCFTRGTHLHVGMDRPTWNCAHPEVFWRTHYAADGSGLIQTCTGRSQSGAVAAYPPEPVYLGFNYPCSSWRRLP